MTVALKDTSLDELERRTVERFVELLEQRLGSDLVAVWLYGSRARGEPIHPESDVDLIVLTGRGDADWKSVDEAMVAAAEGEGANPFRFSTQIFDPDWIEERRKIRSFYIQEVDRDKVVLHGTAL